MSVRRQPQLTRAIALLAVASPAGLCVVAQADAAAVKAKKTTTVSGIVWSDADGNGVRKANEPLVAGAKVTIARKTGKGFKAAKTLTTSKNGAYSYRVTKGGSYRVSVALPSGFATFSPPNRGNDRSDSDLLATGLSAAFTVRLGGASRRVDAGLRPATTPTAPLTQPTATAAPQPAAATPTPAPTPAATPELPTPTPTPTIALGDVVWSDTDQDGRRDAGEPGLAGVKVELHAPDDSVVAQTTSAASGAFSLNATIGATYRLRVELPAGTVFSPKQVGIPSADSDVNRTGVKTGFTDAFTASAALDKLAVGISSPGTTQLGNRVFEDRDGNGLYSADIDRGISSITVNLWNESRTQIVATTVTSSAGLYALQAPRGVSYVLQFVAASYYIVSPQDAGDDTLDSDIFESGANKYFTAPFAVTTVPNGTLDAGFIIPATLGNRVWDDADGDGVQDPGELGLAGVTVQLWNAAKNKVLAQTVSSATGSYSLLAPGAQDYRIRAVLPVGAAFSPKDVGGDNGVDSDINTIGSNLGFTDIIAVDVSLISSTVYDIGIVQP